MKTNIFLLLFFYSISSFSQSFNFGWASMISGSGNESVSAMVTDVNGNSYLTGRFSGTVDFDPNSGVVNLTSNGAPYDIFIIKIDNTGQLIWAKQVGSTAHDVPRGIAVDSSGNVFTCGQFSGTCNFNPSGAAQNITSQGNYDMYILKLDSNGNFVWVSALGSKVDDGMRSITLDSKGNIVAAGFFADTMVVTSSVSSNIFVDTLISNGSNDIFVQKLNPAGNRIWFEQLGGTGDDIAWAVTTDKNDNIITTGYFYGSFDFNPGIAGDNLTSDGALSAVFTQKVDSNGVYKWAKHLGGANFCIGKGVLTDINGNIYTTGDFKSTIDLDPGAATNNAVSNGQNDSFIQKLDANGNYIWGKTWGGTGDEMVGNFVLDKNQNIISIGTFLNTVDFDPSSGSSNLTSGGGQDTYILKINSNGGFEWVKQYFGSGNILGKNIGIDNNDMIYTSGDFGFSADFDPTSGTFNLVAYALSTDIYISRFNETTVGIKEINTTNNFVVFPNPNNGIFKVKFDKDFSQKGEIKIYNQLTQLIYSSEIINNEIEIDISAFPSGIYNFIISTLTESISQKIVIN